MVTQETNEIKGGLSFSLMEEISGYLMMQERRAYIAVVTKIFKNQKTNKRKQKTKKYSNAKLDKLESRRRVFGGIEVNIYLINSGTNFKK